MERKRKPTLLVNRNTTEGQMRYAADRDWNLKISTKIIKVNGREVEVPDWVQS